MNKSELIALEYLKKKGIQEDKIIFNENKSPDFTVIGGAEFEVKRLYGNKILVYETQIEKIKTSTILVVDTNKGKVILEQQYHKLLKTSLISIIKDKDLIKVELKRDTHKRLSELGKKGETFDDIIQRILKII